MFELESSLGFIKKFRGKTRTHPLEVCFDGRGRFIGVCNKLKSYLYGNSRGC